MTGTTTRAEQTRAAIIAAAAELVVENGPSALTHRTIAARAGVSVGSTTKYFASIEDLRRAALDDCARHIHADVDQLAAALRESEDHAATVAAYMSAYLEDPHLVALEMSLIAAGAGSPGTEMVALAAAWNDAFIDRVGPLIGPHAAEAIAMYIDGATISTALNSTALNRAPLSPEHTERAIRALLAAFGEPAPATPPATTAPTTTMDTQEDPR